jgi:hypothetical protein
MSRPQLRIAAMSVALAAAGCAANSAPSKTVTAPLPGKDACVFTANLTDWAVLDDSTLIIYGPVHKEPYLVKLFAPVTGLQFRESLGFEATEHNGQLCRGDYVVARGDVPQRMAISALRAISPEQATQLRAAAK